MQNTTSEPFGIVFDIDGVLLKSHKAIPEAKEALQLLVSATKNQIPVVFATNDGGTPEHIKASILSQELGISVCRKSVF
jgi:ribonucleotide monophosphatase NagD (HAD superfamily)